MWSPNKNVCEFISRWSVQSPTPMTTFRNMTLLSLHICFNMLMNNMLMNSSPDVQFSHQYQYQNHATHIHYNPFMNGGVFRRWAPARVRMSRAIRQASIRSAVSVSNSQSRQFEEYYCSNNASLLLSYPKCVCVFVNPRIDVSEWVARFYARQWRRAETPRARFTHAQTARVTCAWA